MTFRMIKCKLQKKNPPNITKRKEKLTHRSILFSFLLSNSMCLWVLLLSFFPRFDFCGFYGVNNVFCSMFHVWVKGQNFYFFRINRMSFYGDIFWGCMGCEWHKSFVFFLLHFWFMKICFDYNSTTSIFVALTFFF